MAASNKSPEYKAFHSQYSSISDQLAGNQAVILPFATSLYSADIIDKVIHQNIQDGRNPPYERVVAILTAVETNLSHNPEKIFKEIVLSLRKVQLTKAADELIEALVNNGGTLPPELMPISPNDSYSSLSSPERSLLACELELEDGEPDVNDLMNYVAVPLGDGWRLLATALKFDKGEISAIEADNPTGSLECCRDMFLRWQSKATPPYLWSTLTEALENPAVKRKGLIKEIEKQRRQIAEETYSKHAKKEPSLSELMEKIGCQVTDKWKALGSELGLAGNSLNSIGARYRNDIDRVMEVFSRWESQIPKPYTWQVLLIALSKPQVGHLQLAKNIDTSL